MWVSAEFGCRSERVPSHVAISNNCRRKGPTKPVQTQPEPRQQCGPSVSISKIENDKLEANKKCHKLGQGAAYYAEDDAVWRDGVASGWCNYPGSGSTA